MVRIIAVAKDQAGDLLRRRYLIVILILGLIIIGLFIGYMAVMRQAFGFMSEAPQRGAPKPSDTEGAAMAAMMVGYLQVGLHSLVAFLGTLLSVVIMSTTLRGEISSGTARMVLSRPVARYEFLAGKWLGCVFMVLVYTAVMGVVVATYSYLEFGQVPSYVPISMAMAFLKAVLVGSVAMMLSVVLHPLVAILIAYFAAGETFLFIAGFLDGVARVVVLIPFYVLPSYKAFNMLDVIISASVDWAHVGYVAAYGLLYSGLILLAAAALFRKRDLL